MLLLFQSFNVTAQDFIPTIIDGEVVYEFGDFGKAPNQYPLKVGDLNVISSTHVFRVDGQIHIVEPPRATSDDKKVPELRNQLNTK